MLLTEKEFLDNKEAVVADVLVKLRHLAKVGAILWVACIIAPPARASYELHDTAFSVHRASLACNSMHDSA
jgi:hypothetical protein